MTRIYLGHIVGKMDAEKGTAPSGDSLERMKEEAAPQVPSSSRTSVASLNAPRSPFMDEEKMQAPLAPTAAQDGNITQLHEEKDPFEVGWDGGDQDPLCPRSMAEGRKWMIVLITCFGSLCVQVSPLKSAG